MKIKKIIIFIIILVLIIILPTLIFFLSNLAFWPWNNYIFANSINKNLEKVFSKNELLKLKKADYYYRLGEYDKSLENYLKIDCKDDKVCFNLYHNIWNTYYKLSQNQIPDLEKISLLQKSLSYYSKALNIQFDQETKKNYDFVLEKLNELIKKTKEDSKQEEKPKQEESKSEEDKQENQDNKEQENKNDEESENKQTQENQNSENTNSWETQGNSQEQQNQTQIQPKWPSMKIDEEREDAKNKLSLEEQKQIENYIEWLKLDEQQNINLNKPQKSNDLFDILRDDFFFEWFDKNENWW